MLSKILKYDSKALYKSLLPLMLASIGSAGIAFVLNEWQSSLSLLDAFLPCVVLEGVSLFFNIAVYALFAVQIVMILFRYYKSMFTDEGYLTFVIPASTARIFTGKFLAGSLWGVLSAFVLALSVFLTDIIYNIEAGNMPGIFFTDIFDYLGVHPLVVLLSGVSEVMVYWIMLYTGINIGSVLFAKHKVLGSLLFIFALSSAKNTLSSVMSLGVVFSVEEYYSNGYFILTSVLSLLLFAGMYWLSLWMLHRKLNLE